uniref:Uncharacterized protein n=1 Tax=Mucochytrium quahogii TaxID=96639 RepID=A0A7S2RR87_9STRA
MSAWACWSNDYYPSHYYPTLHDAIPFRKAVQVGDSAVYIGGLFILPAYLLAAVLVGCVLLCCLRKATCASRMNARHRRIGFWVFFWGGMAFLFLVLTILVSNGVDAYNRSYAGVYFSSTFSAYALVIDESAYATKGAAVLARKASGTCLNLPENVSDALLKIEKLLQNATSVLQETRESRLENALKGLDWIVSLNESLERYTIPIIAPSVSIMVLSMCTFMFICWVEFFTSRGRTCCPSVRSWFQGQSGRFAGKVLLLLTLGLCVCTVLAMVVFATFISDLCSSQDPNLPQYYQRHLAESLNAQEINANPTSSTPICTPLADQGGLSDNPVGIFMCYLQTGDPRNSLFGSVLIDCTTSIDLINGINDTSECPAVIELQSYTTENLTNTIATIRKIFSTHAGPIRVDPNYQCNPSEIFSKYRWNNERTCRLGDTYTAFWTGYMGCTALLLVVTGMYIYFNLNFPRDHNFSLCAQTIELQEISKEPAVARAQVIVEESQSACTGGIVNT